MGSTFPREEIRPIGFLSEIFSRLQSEKTFSPRNALNLFFLRQLCNEGNQNKWTRYKQLICELTAESIRLEI